MCGIVAVIKHQSNACSTNTIHKMIETVKHRGPDDSGAQFLCLTQNGLQMPTSSDTSCWNVGLGHRRLSILDLSPGGHQPMRYGEQYWIIYNGEVYNFLELRAELEKL